MLGKPYSVVGFDEVEKAHPDVFDALLQVLDDGRLTDAQGRIVGICNTVIIMTSNVGSEYLIDSVTSQGELHEDAPARVMAELRLSFRPEFLTESTLVGGELVLTYRNPTPPGDRGRRRRAGGRLTRRSSMVARMAVRDWRWQAVRAVAAFAFGILTLVMPGITLTALVILFGAYALVDGVFSLVGAFFAPRESGRMRVWLGVLGVLGIGAGVVTFVWPAITAVALLYVIAVWALVTGVFEIATAVALRSVIRHEWPLVLDGLLSVALGMILLIVSPVLGALAITWAIGWYAVVASGMMAAHAWNLRELQHATGMGGGWQAASG